VEYRVEVSRRDQRWVLSREHGLREVLECSASVKGEDRLDDGRGRPLQRGLREAC
jgi:hypothetical protein